MFKKISHILNILGVILLQVSLANAEQRVYFSTDAAASGVYSARLDGSDIKLVINFKNPVLGAPRAPGALAIDDVAGRLYIVDTSSTFDLLSSDLNGGDLQLIYDDANLITDVTVDPLTGIIYWSSQQGYIGRKRPGFPVDQNFAGNYNGVAVAPISSKFFFGGPTAPHFYNLPAWANGGRMDLSPTPYLVDRVEHMHAANQLTWFNPTNNRLMAKRVGEGVDRELLQFPSSEHVPLLMSFNRTESHLFYTNTVFNKIFIAPLSDFNVSNPPQTFFSVNAPRGIAISCGVFAPNTDGDAMPDCDETCPNDASKISAGICGCGVSDADSDGDGTANCLESCPNDPLKTAPGVCGCNVHEVVGCGIPTPTPIPTAEPTSTPIIITEVIRDLTPGLKITEPPEVKVINNDIVIILEKFLKVALNKPGKGIKDRALLEAKSPKISSRYIINVKKAGSKTKDFKTYTTKKNQITIKNLKPGNYTVNYKAEILKDGKVAGKTSLSPKANFTIQ